MTISNKLVTSVTKEKYKYGFVTDIDSELAPPGLSEDIVRWISAKKDEPKFMLDWRLKAYRHWDNLLKTEAIPQWANVNFRPIDFQDMIYYSAPKPKKELSSLEEVDKELLSTYEKLGIPLEEQKRLAGVAVDRYF